MLGFRLLRRLALATLLSNPKGSQAGRGHEAWGKGPVQGDIQHVLRLCKEISPAVLHRRTSELVSKPQTAEQSHQQLPSLEMGVVPGTEARLQLFSLLFGCCVGW